MLVSGKNNKSCHHKQNVLGWGTEKYFQSDRKYLMIVCIWQVGLTQDFCMSCGDKKLKQAL